MSCTVGGSKPLKQNEGRNYLTIETFTGTFPGVLWTSLRYDYARMGMVKVALVFPLLRLNRLELSLPQL